MEFVTNTAIAAYVRALERLGLTRPVVGQLREATERNLSVPVLRFQGRVSCTYVGQDDVKVVVAEREVERNAAGSSPFLPNSISTETTKVKKTVPQYVWDVQLAYNVTAMEGGAKGKRILLRGGTSSQTVVTRVKTSPLEQAFDRIFDLPLTWLLQNLSPVPVSEGSSSDTDTALTSTFSVDRLDASCKTPRRNDNVRDALDFDRDLHAWASRVREYMLRVDRLQRSPDNAGAGPTFSHRENPSPSDSSKRRLAALLESSEMFIPIMPLMDNRTVMLDDADAILAEHARSVDAVLESIDQEFGAHKHGQTNESLIESDEAGLTLLCHHLTDLSQAYVRRVPLVRRSNRQQPSLAHKPTRNTCLSFAATPTPSSTSNTC